MPSEAEARQEPTLSFAQIPLETTGGRCVGRTAWRFRLGNLGESRRTAPKPVAAASPCENVHEPHRPLR